MPRDATLTQIVRHYVEVHSAGRTLDELGKALKARTQKGSSSAISDWMNGKRAPSSRIQLEALRDIVGCEHWDFDLESIRRAWSDAPNNSDSRDLNPMIDTAVSAVESLPRRDRQADPSARSTRRRAVIGIALLGGFAMAVASLWRDPPSAQLSIVDSQVVYLPAGEDLGSVIDVRLRNDGGATSQVHRLTVLVEQIEQYPYQPCSERCLPRTGSQAAVVYSIALDQALPGQKFVRDIGLTVEPAGVERMVLAFSGTTPNTCTVAHLKVSLEADGGRPTNVITADIFMVTGPPEQPARQLTDRQLALTLQDAALPVLTPDAVRGELIGRKLPVPTWLGEQ